MIPQYVVVSGLRASGKSEVCRFLVSELGFTSVGLPTIVPPVYGTSLKKFYERPDFRERFEDARRISRYIALLLLNRGHDVVLEGAFRSQRQRSEALDVMGALADRYLLVLERSGLADTRPFEYIEPGWSPYLKCQVIVYQNNGLQDMETIKADLRGRFQRKGGILVPASPETVS